MREVAIFVCECCADGVNKKSCEKFLTVKCHFTTYSQNLTHKKILGVLVFLESYFLGQI